MAEVSRSGQATDAGKVGKATLEALTVTRGLGKPSTVVRERPRPGRNAFGPAR